MASSTLPSAAPGKGHWVQPANGSKTRRRAASLAVGISVAALGLVGLAPVALADTAAQTTISSGLANPGGLAFASNGDIYIAGGAQNKIVKVDATTHAATDLVSSGLNG